MFKVHCILNWVLLALAFELLMIKRARCTAENDNFIIFTEDVKGYPITSTDGFVYFVGTSISKVDLASRVVEKIMRIATSDLSTNISYDYGILNEQETVLLAIRKHNGPNCATLISITTSDMVLQEDN